MERSPNQISKIITNANSNLQRHQTFEGATGPDPAPEEEGAQSHAEQHFRILLATARMQQHRG